MSIKNTVSDFSPYLFSTLNKHCFKIQSVLGDMYCFFNTVFICIRYIYKKCCYNSVWNFVIWSYWYFECLDMNLLKMYLLLLSEKVLHVPLEGDCKHPVTWWHWSLVELHRDVQPGPKYIAGHWRTVISEKPVFASFVYVTLKQMTIRIEHMC